MPRGFLFLVLAAVVIVLNLKIVSSGVLKKGFSGKKPAPRVSVVARPAPAPPKAPSPAIIDVSSIISLLEKLGSNLTVNNGSELFSEDSFLIQDLHVFSNLTKYLDTQNHELYSRNSIDENKQVVVLHPMEDKRSFNASRKRTFIVLLKAPPVIKEENQTDKVEKIHYFPTFAYVREPRPTDPKTDYQYVLPSEIPMIVEWDAWDKRSTTPGDFHPGWLTCGYSLFFSCSINMTVINTALNTSLIEIITMEAIQAEAIEAAAEKEKANLAKGPYRPIVTPRTTPRPTPKPTPAPPPAINGTLLPIRLEGVVDMRENLDLYGDFDDVYTKSKQTGRGLMRFLCNRLFGRCNSNSTNKAKKKKRVKLIPGEKSETIYGTYYTGVKKNTPKIFIPDDGEDDYPSVVFIPQNIQLGWEIKGVFIPGAPESHDVLIADDEKQTMGLKSTRGTIVPEEMITSKIVGGGIHGTLTGERFDADELPSQIWLDPDLPDYKGVWILDNKSVLKESKTEEGYDIIDGILFEGVLGTSEIFISDDEDSIPGTFLTIDPDQPLLVEFAHGAFFVTTKPTLGHGEFKPDNIKDMDKILVQKKVRGVFMPDGMNNTGMFSGLLTISDEVADEKTVKNYVFVADIPGEAFQYIYGSPNTSTSIWTSFLKPGEWNKVIPPPPEPEEIASATVPLDPEDLATSTNEPLVSTNEVVPSTNEVVAVAPAEAEDMGTTTAAPTITTAPYELAPLAEAVAPPDPQSEMKTQIPVINPAFMFGVRFPSMGDTDVFIPDYFNVSGSMIPEDLANGNEMTGIISGLGRTPKNSTFIPDSPSMFQLENLKQGNALFVPAGIAPGNGIVGILVVNDDKISASFIPEPSSQSYWYVKGKPENELVWTPFNTSSAGMPTTRKPTIFQRMNTVPFILGSYFPSVGALEPVFIPHEGATGCFYPDKDKGLVKYCGVFYPETSTAASEFVLESPTAPHPQNNVPGTFVPRRNNDDEFPNKLKVTFVNRPPGTLSVTGPNWLTWAQIDVKIPLKNTRTLKSNETFNHEDEKHPSNIAVSIGGGFFGYPANGKAMEALMDANNPVFKEFVQWKTRQDKTMKYNERILLFDTPADIAAFQRSISPIAQASLPHLISTAFLTLEEYRKYVTERFTIKITKVQTADIDARLKLVVPKAAESYIKKKNFKKTVIDLKVNSRTDAEASADTSGSGAIGSGSSSASGGATGSIKGLKGGKNCKAGFTTNSKALAKAENGSASTALATAKDGGDASSMAVSKDPGARSSAVSNATDGGKATAFSAGANAIANALRKGVATAIAKDKDKGTATANAETLLDKDNPGNHNDCNDGGMPDEIHIDSESSAHHNETSGGGGTKTSNAVASAKTNVKIDLAALYARIAEMDAKRAESEGHDDDDDDDHRVTINIDAYASAANQKAKGRAILNGLVGTIGIAIPKSVQIRALMATLEKQTEGENATGYQRLGWKTEWKPVVPNITFGNEKSIFFGFGSCPSAGAGANYAPPPPPDHNGDVELIINFYIKIMNVDCTPSVARKIRRQIKTGFLELDPGAGNNYFRVPSNLSILFQPKLSGVELRKLSAGFEFSMFTKEYWNQYQITNSKKPVGRTAVAIKDDYPISRSVRFITDFTLRFIQESRVQVPKHTVRLTRNLLSTLRTVMVLLYQDGNHIRQACGDVCFKDQELNGNDQVQVMGLIQFIIHGLGPFDKGKDQDLKKSLYGFLRLNRKALEQRVREYKNNFPPKQ